MSRLRQLESRRRWALLVFAVALLIFGLDIWWFLVHRSGYPFDIDEAGYSTFGINDYIGLHEHGVHGWWEAIQNQPTFAPLVPALTSLTVWVHPGVLNGFAVLALFALLLPLVVYGIAEPMVGPGLGAVAALATATLPGVFAFSREYIFALPTAFFLLCAVFALLRSDGLRRRGWSIACGVALGLMLLSRTMAIAYVPGILLTGVIVAYLRGRGTDLPRRAINLVLLVLVGGVVAATWYARNLQSVINYLTGYGYGNQSKYYGTPHAFISWGRFSSVAERITGEDLFVPLAAITLVALGALVFVTVRSIRRSPDRVKTVEKIVASDKFAVCLIFIFGYGALMTSQNGGDGFTIPISVLLPTIAVMALALFPRAILPALSLVAVIAIVNVVSTATISDGTSKTVLVSLPLVKEQLPLVKGTPKAVFAIRQQVPGPESRFDSHDSQWLRADRRTVAIINSLDGPYGESPVVAFASRDRASNTNTVGLASIIKYHRGLPVEQMLAEEGDTVANYESQLSEGPLGEAGVLVTESSNVEDFPPPITQAKAVAAARRLGFHRLKNDTMTLPDGRHLFFWKRGS